VNVAVIGAGISGLTAALELARRHDVTLFEANDYLGGHTHTVDIEYHGERQSIDTGFIVYNDWTYPNFIALLDQLGVASQPTEMSFSVRCDRTGLEYSGSSLNGLFAQRRNLVSPRFYRLLADILRFNRAGHRDGERVAAAGTGSGAAIQGATAGLSEPITVGKFLRDGRYSRVFCEHYLLPMGAAIWSCPTGTFENFPLEFIFEFYRNHGLLNVWQRPQWRVIQGGSRSYVRKMMDRFRGRVRLATPIERVQRFSDRVEVVPRGGAVERYEHAVLACHSDQALGMLADPSPLEKELLGAFPYERNVAVLHTDTSILPKRRRAWSSWNYRIDPQNEARATLTYNMNILQGLKSEHVYNVTLNDEGSIDPAKILGRYHYAHPIFTTRRAAVQARHRELCNVNRTSYCGAYWRNGFHEDGVVSAQAVCRAIGGVDDRS
jgi:predicted NAD/FAD-binding protein